jgi:hypothetical protein
MKTATLIAASLLSLTTGLAYADGGADRVPALNGRQAQAQQAPVQKSAAEHQAADAYAGKVIAANPDNYRNH